MNNMICNEQLNNFEKRYLELVLSFFGEYRDEIVRQINAAKIEREEYSDHLYLGFSYDEHFEAKQKLPGVASISVECEDGDEVDLILHRFTTEFIEELEVLSYLFCELDCDKICKGLVKEKHILKNYFDREIWTFNKDTKNWSVEIPTQLEVTVCEENEETEEKTMRVEVWKKDEKTGQWFLGNARDTGDGDEN